jgi:preprotein translocase subunit SecY
VQKLTAFFKRVLATPELRRKLIFTAAIFLVFRLLAHIPVPSVDIVQLRSLFADSQFLSLLNVFSGGLLANFSIAAVGINPYITASIIMQLSAMVIPQLKELQKEGESGRERVNQYTRMLSVPLAIGQSVSVLALLRSQGLLETTQPIALIAMITSMVAGAMILMWLGELISLYGLGNGISMILLGGILSQLPGGAAQLLLLTTSEQFMTLASFVGMFLVIIGLIVFMNEAIRKVPIQYAKRVRGSRMYGGQQTHLPIKVNVAGVLPIIFAVSLMLMPSFVARMLIATDRPDLIEWGQRLTIMFTETSPVYMTTYFLLVFFFTFFSALVFFNAGDISQELKKSGAFVPGIRPGAATKKFLERVVTRVTLAGAIFLSMIALIPSFAQLFTNIDFLAISGTSVLIVVSVILDTSKQAQSMFVDQQYDKYL